jgi:DNA-binding MarR family transcriptional regulator
MTKTAANVDVAEILRITAKVNRHLIVKNKKLHEVIILVALGRVETINMSTLADWTGQSFSITSRIVSRLEKAGLVKKNRNLNDKRIVNINLTKEGQDEYKTLEQLLESIAL